MPEPLQPHTLPVERAERWTRQLAAALKALRLNRHFPAWRTAAGWLQHMSDGGPLRVDRRSGLPVARHWVRLRVERDMAEQALAELEGVEAGRLAAADARQLQRRRDRLAALPELPELPARSVSVALRHQQGDQASYQVIVDRLDIATATLARYTLVVGDQVGQRVSAGELELRASEAFRERLELLSTQDAALAFAVLRQGGLQVQEVVRGVIGPGWLAGAPACGPDALGSLGLKGPLLSACLERASVDLSEGLFDDPLARSVTVPGEGVDFGVTRHRKWAAPRGDQAALKAWLKGQGSRNLVYAIP